METDKRTGKRIEENERGKRAANSIHGSEEKDHSCKVKYITGVLSEASECEEVPRRTQRNDRKLSHLKKKEKRKGKGLKGEQSLEEDGARLTAAGG